MELSIDSVKQIANDIMNSIESEINNGVKFHELEIKHTTIYKKILSDSQVSNEKDEIVNYLSWLLYAGGVQNFNFAKTHDALDKIIPIVNNLVVLTKGQPALVAEIQKLQSIIKRTNESRSRGGKNKDKAKQESMQQIEQAYKDKIASGYSFKLGQLSKFYTAMAEEHDLDFGSIKNRVEKLRQTLGHTARPKKQSS